MANCQSQAPRAFYCHHKSFQGNDWLFINRLARSSCSETEQQQQQQQQTTVQH